MSKKSDKMRKLIAGISKVEVKEEKKAKKKSPKAKKVDADMNKDGVVDEKDAGIMEKIVKKIRKKKS